MIDVIELRGLRIAALCGALPEERVRRQPFSFDIDVHADISMACQSDDLADTINYGALTADVQAMVEAEQFTLLERMAERVAEVVLANPQAQAVDVAVRKLRPPVPEMLETSGVRIHRSRA